MASTVLNSRLSNDLMKNSVDITKLSRVIVFARVVALENDLEHPFNVFLTLPDILALGTDACVVKKWCMMAVRYVFKELGWISQDFFDTK